MAITIFWTETAEQQLKEIFQYYSRQASRNIARNVVSKIINRVSILERNPLAGQKEELLANSPSEYRYLVESNYKIIYWKENDRITIATVFDCRQNPVKMFLK